MPKFKYTAKTLAGQTVKGEIIAAEEKNVVVQLRAQKLIPILIEPLVAKKVEKSTKIVTSNVDGKDLAIFTRQFSTLVNAGVAIREALEILSRGRRAQVLKDAASGVQEKIEKGLSLGNAMSAHPNVFDRFYVNMVAAGEQAGVLDVILSRLSGYIEKSVKLKRQVKGALTYPIIILFVSAVVVTGLLVFVVPRMQAIYEGSGQALPIPTQIIIAVSQFIFHKGHIILGVLVATIFLLLQYFKTLAGRRTLHLILLEIPIFGDLVQKSAVARFTRTLATLLESGIGILEALEIAARTCGNMIIEAAIIEAKDSIAQGRSISKPLAKSGKIPEMVTDMIAVGEESGTLSEMLSKIADFYEEEVDVVVKSMSTIIEPVLMVVLGVTVAVIVVAMYLPILNMGSVVGG